MPYYSFYYILIFLFVCILTCMCLYGDVYAKAFLYRSEGL